MDRKGIADTVTDGVTNAVEYVEEKADEIYDTILSEKNYIHNKSAYPIFAFSVAKTVSATKSQKGFILSTLNNIRKQVMSWDIDTLDKSIIRKNQIRLVNQNLPLSVGAICFAPLKSLEEEKFVARDPTAVSEVANLLKILGNPLGDDNVSASMVMMAVKGVSSSFVAEDNGIYRTVEGTLEERGAKICGWGEVGKIT